MTKQEALLFLELTETAGPAEIKTRLAEKLAHFELLSEKAPSDFLRRLNLRNLDKVKVIIKDSLQWPSYAVPETLQPETVPEEIMEESAQTVYIVNSLREDVLKSAEEAASRKRLPGDPGGWLILHTENQPAKAYAVQMGKNFVGRKKQPGLEPFIVIEGDDFMSRVQCVVYAEEEETGLVFFISDPSAFNNGKTSKNGTYINGNPELVTQKVKLADSDTIQLGVSKFMVKYNINNLDILIQEVKKSNYVKTVLLDA